MLPRAHTHVPDSGPGVERHWGYLNRQLPCTSDAGKCAYLDTVYHSHDLSVLYSAILWAVILGVLFLIAVGRFIPFQRTSSGQRDVETETPRQSTALYRLKRFFKAMYHRYLLQESLPQVFGRTTRFNLLVLAILCVYLIIFSFVGIIYKTWYSPVSGHPNLRQTRVGMGPWADRVGVLAYALTPLAVLLATRESLLSLLTGIPYHHFNFLHRWLGYVIYAQSVLHTLGWIIIEGRLYQPQPTTWTTFIAQEYMIWGVVALILLSFLVFASTKTCIRWTGYEFFRKSHYVVAMLYVGACWGHWAQLSCWMIASLVVWLLDRAARLLRTAILHVSAGGQSSARSLQIPRADMTCFPSAEDGDVVRLDFDHAHAPWALGQHFYLCFPELSIWQSHPMTPSSLPAPGHRQRHSYLIRAKGGLTKHLAALTQRQTSTPIVLSGPYGQSIAADRTDDINILCVAGGTGVTFVLPLLLSLVRGDHAASPRRGLLEFIWIVRRRADIDWIRSEMDELCAAAEAQPGSFLIRVFVTREDGSGEQTALVKEHLAIEISSGEKPPAQLTVLYTASHATRHPDVPSQVTDFVSRTAQGPTRVIASGPTGLVSDLRRVVASCNDPAKVWKGEERFDVQLVHDDRLEW
ncbi:ferric reductase family protein [Aspergillus clavatus NRRL 1]|uniref:ferric-chelate reductase (NADPH) n=1 Tax=Aspergillus clavatus (strain ATCC 1007 / CBS 513.65 / DSM 816 / NCTC 3887 / NRRL 1 / QM 1276 / 107) TaxID=344612 RepID=A1CUM1_ASPCL|nr:ferric-chelate reductase, putative [Aspergillus clavatus NRRL 1]EAW07008.1 ferric-chelate reductase, putative [Aspergillus clavatus NRRL 1]